MIPCPLHIRTVSRGHLIESIMTLVGRGLHSPRKYRTWLESQTDQALSELLNFILEGGMSAIISPIDCNSEEEVCGLKTNPWRNKDFWFLTDGYEVSIVKQKGGEAETQSISIPKKVFDKMVKFYTEAQ